MYSEALLAEIKELIDAQRETLWSAADIAEFLKLSKSSVQNRIVPRPDFPSPFVFSEQRTKRWDPKEVRKWAYKQR
jgi:hypothetical protein